VQSQNCKEQLLALSRLSICLSAWNKSGPTGWIFMTFDSSVFFETSVDTIQVSLKSGNNNKYFTWRCTHIYKTTLSNSSQNEKCHTQKLQRVSKHTFYVQELASGKSCRLWDNVEKHGRTGLSTDGNAIRRKRFAYRINKTTDTRWEYVILTDFPRQQWLRERSTALRLYVHCLV